MIFNLANKKLMPKSVGITYGGAFTDNRVDGVGTVRLSTSGTLIVDRDCTVTAYIQAGGGGGAYAYFTSESAYGAAGGGGGGYQTVTVNLVANEEYVITIGAAGAGVAKSAVSYVNSGGGGSTVAFGYTCTGGGGAQAHGYYAGNCRVGSAGSPNGGTGTKGLGKNATGGAPNGGSVVNGGARNGGAGYVEITFS